MDLNPLLTLHLSSVMRSCRHYPHYRPLKDEIPLPYDVRLRQGYNKDEYREATPLHHVKLTSGELMTIPALFSLWTPRTRLQVLSRTTSSFRFS
ncbi:hypothetical protein AVEN_259580-1 [Araneus ventricosus]|uniref:Uncharacterized protein n=1 Tax=Araneus ventricosus TaxID=182803 RepID=A0A4Y2EQB9_ARAVE|nr:hypothetical protein AVEN_259580-1 [Araneus ventricosus]